MFITYIITIGILIPVLIIDIKKKIIPDFLILILFLSYIGIYFFTDKTLLSLSLIKSTIIFIVLFTVYKIVGGIGFGDVKLISILGYGFSLPNLYIMLLTASISGIIYILAIQKIKKTKDIKIAFCPFIFSGVLVSFLIEVIR